MLDILDWEILWVAWAGPEIGVKLCQLEMFSSLTLRPVRRRILIITEFRSLFPIFKFRFPRQSNLRSSESVSLTQIRHKGCPRFFCCLNASLQYFAILCRPSLIYSRTFLLEHVRRRLCGVAAQAPLSESGSRFGIGVSNTGPPLGHVFPPHIKRALKESV